MFIIAIVGFIILGIADVRLRSKYNIERNERFLDQYVNIKHFIFELWLIVMALFVMMGRGIEGKQFYVVLFIFFALVFAIRALFDYMFRKASKRHIISLMYTFVFLFVALFILLFG